MHYGSPVDCPLGDLIAFKVHQHFLDAWKGKSCCVLARCVGQTGNLLVTHNQVQ